MQIRGGTARGLRIDVPTGQQVRPTTDRIRESVFAILRELIPEARVLDLFAGSGSLGLEAASRGAASVDWVEKHLPTTRILQKNIDRLAPAGVSTRTRLHVGPVVGWLSRYTGEGYDVIFADPPYADLQGSGEVNALLDLLLTSAAWGEGSLLVLETDGHLSVALPPPWSCLRREDYGTTSVWFVEAVGTGSGNSGSTTVSC